MPQDFAFDAYTVYTLKVPDGYKTWVIISDPNGGGAEWCYTNRKDAAKVEEVCTNKVLLERYIYSSGEKVRVLSYDSSVVNVSLGDGRSGWVARDLVEIPKEQLQEYEARQKANVKQLADAKALESKLEAKKASKARAEQAERQAKERAYIATLPKLQGGSN